MDMNAQKQDEEQQQMDAEQAQTQDLESREMRVVSILKSIDMGLHDHEDILYLASELGVSKYFFN